MANKNRRKGHDAEREVVKMFQDLGYKYCVTARYGSRQHDDCGIDVINIPFNVQVKAGYSRGLNYSKVLRDIAERIGESFPKYSPEHTQPTVIIHRKDVGRFKLRTEFDDLVVMTKETFKQLIDEKA